MSRTIRRKGKVPDWLYDRYVTIKSKKKVTRQYTRWNWETGEKKVTTHSYFPIYFLYLPKEEWTLSNKDRAAYHSNKWFTHRKTWAKRYWAKKRRQHDRRERDRMIREEYEPLWFQTQVDTWLWD